MDSRQIYDKQNMDITYWSVRLSHRMGRNWGKGGEWDIVILASYKFQFFRVHDNLKSDPNNNLIASSFNLIFNRN